MLKGVWWLIAVWGGFIVLVAAHNSEAFSSGNQDSNNVRMINAVPGEAFEGRDTNSNVNDIGLNAGSCKINRFWKSLGIEKVSVEAPICSSADLRLA